MWLHPASILHIALDHPPALVVSHVIVILVPWPVHIIVTNALVVVEGIQSSLIASLSSSAHVLLSLVGILRHLVVVAVVGVSHLIVAVLLSHLLLSIGAILVHLSIIVHSIATLPILIDDVVLKVHVHLVFVASAATAILRLLVLRIIPLVSLILTLNSWLLLLGTSRLRMRSSLLLTLGSWSIIVTP